MVSSRTTSGAATAATARSPVPPGSACAVGAGDDADALVRALRAADPATRLRAVRKLKNDVIANRGRKARFIAAGAAPALVDALRDALSATAAAAAGGGGAAPMETEGQASGVVDGPAIAVQAAAAVSSLAYGTAEGADAVRATGGVGALLEALASGDARVAEAGVRSLRLLHEVRGGEERGRGGAGKGRRTGGRGEKGLPSTHSHALPLSPPSQSPLAPAAVAAPLPPAALRQLVRLLGSAAPGAAAVAAVVLARACAGARSCGLSSAPPPATPDDAAAADAADATVAAVVAEGGVDALVRLLVGEAGTDGTPSITTLTTSPPPPNAVAAAAASAAAAALRPLLRAVPSAATAVADNPPAVFALVHLLRSPDEGGGGAGAGARPGPSAQSRLAAAACLIHLAPALQTPLDAGGGARSAALTAIVRLLRDGEVGHDAAAVLADLLAAEDGDVAEAAAVAAVTLVPGSAAGADPPPGGGGSPGPGPPPGGSLRARAADAGAVDALCDLVAGRGGQAAAAAGGGAATPPATPPHQPAAGGALRALASLCGPSEAARSNLASHAGALPAIVAALDSPAPTVRAAACACVRAATRSARALRTGLAEAAPGLAGPLVRLLADPDPGVRAAASAALCNVVLDFSPAKAALLDAGVLPALARLAVSPAPAERLNAAWALQNLAYHATPGLRPRLLGELPWGTAASLAADPDDGRVRVRALNLLQNLFAHASPADCAATAAWGGAGLFEELAWRVREGAAVLAVTTVWPVVAGVDAADWAQFMAGFHPPAPAAPPGVVAAFRAALGAEVAAALAVAGEGGGVGGGGATARGAGRRGGGRLPPDEEEDMEEEEEEGDDPSRSGGGASAAVRPASAPSTSAAASAQPPPTTATTELRHALYALSNAAATGGEAERGAALAALLGGLYVRADNALPRTRPPPLFAPLMGHPDPAIRLAVAWLVVNLAAPGQPQPAAATVGEAAEAVPAPAATAAAATRIDTLVLLTTGVDDLPGSPGGMDLAQVMRAAQQEDPAADVRSRAGAAADRLEALAAALRLDQEGAGGGGGSGGRGRGRGRVAAMVMP